MCDRFTNALINRGNKKLTKVLIKVLLLSILMSGCATFEPVKGAEQQVA